MTWDVQAEMRVGSIPTLDSVSKRYETLKFNVWSNGCELGQTLDTNSCHVGTSDGCKVKISTREDLHTWESLLHQCPVTILSVSSHHDRVA